MSSRKSWNNERNPAYRTEKNSESSLSLEKRTLQLKSGRPQRQSEKSFLQISDASSHAGVLFQHMRNFDVCKQRAYDDKAESEV